MWHAVKMPSVCSKFLYFFIPLRKVLGVWEMEIDLRGYLFQWPNFTDKSVIYLNVNLLSACYVPGTVLSSGDTKNPGENSSSQRAHCLMRRQYAGNYEKSKNWQD